MLCCSGSVEAHDEVVTSVVLSLVFSSGFGEEEGTPVGEAANHTAGGEDLLTGGAGDPESESVNHGRAPWEGWKEMVKVILFDLG